MTRDGVPVLRVHAKDATRRMSSLAGLRGDRGESMGDKRSKRSSASESESRAPSLGKGVACDAPGPGAPPPPRDVESNISDSFPAVLLLPLVYPAEKLLNICQNTPFSALRPWRAGVSAAPSLLPRRCACVEPDGPAKLAGPEERGARNSPRALSYEVSRRWCPGSPRARACALAAPPSREPPAAQVSKKVEAVVFGLRGKKGQILQGEGHGRGRRERDRWRRGAPGGDHGARVQT